jgi:hypothetical protein
MKPSDEQLLESKRQKELFHRSIEMKSVEIVNSKPGITFEELAKELGVRIEDICSIVVSRLNVDSLPITLRHPEGRRVSYNGQVGDDYGD